jgi:hypothetical protein
VHAGSGAEGGVLPVAGARPKKLRFSLFNLAGHITEHAGKLILHLGRVAERLVELVRARRRLLEIPPAPSRGSLLGKRTRGPGAALPRPLRPPSALRSTAPTHPKSCRRIGDRPGRWAWCSLWCTLALAEADDGGADRAVGKT